MKFRLFRTAGMKVSFVILLIGLTIAWYYYTQYGIYELKKALLTWGLAVTLVVGIMIPAVYWMARKIARKI